MGRIRHYVFYIRILLPKFIRSFGGPPPLAIVGEPRHCMLEPLGFVACRLEAIGPSAGNPLRGGPQRLYVPLPAVLLRRSRYGQLAPDLAAQRRGGVPKASDLGRDRLTAIAAIAECCHGRSRPYAIAHSALVNSRADGGQSHQCVARSACTPSTLRAAPAPR